MMKIVQKIVQKQNANSANPAVTVAFLGDSVTQGCFEIYKKSPTEIETVFDKQSAYHKYFADILSVICPSVPVNIINAGISGGTVPHALERLDRDVLKYCPDLVVVCFGLNDSSFGLEKLSEYTNGLREIFDRIQKSGAELIFMTPNMKCTKVSCHVTDPLSEEIAENQAKGQNEGVMDRYIEAALEICKDNDIIVCDCYKKWKALYECGIDITELLSNKINHPTREMNYMFAYSLVETIFGM